MKEPKLIFFEGFLSEFDARKREQYFKTSKGWILDGKNGAEIEKWLLSKLKEAQTKVGENKRIAYQQGFKEARLQTLKEVEEWVEENTHEYELSDWILEGIDSKELQDKLAKLKI